ncbi:MAG: sigma-70 family RNA polymerase sigma factor [Cyclobacteriaceae bacterium]|nr:sigma-70 family RNA polymerase sigma factor [Cyclobacteriaceae bacterium]
MKVNSSAFEILYERNVSLLANYGKRICQDKELVKDAIQDVYVDLWRNRSNLGRTDSIKYYLLKALRRNLVKKLVAAKNADTRNQSAEDVLASFETSHDFTLMALEIETEKIRQVNELLDSLPARQKEAIYLRFYNGFNFTEISSIMGINQQSAYNMVFRAIESLREKVASTTILLQIIAFFELL